MRCLSAGKYQVGSSTVSILYICYKDNKTYRVLAKRKGSTVGGDQIWEINIDGRTETVYVPRGSRAEPYLRERIQSILP